MNKQKAVNQYDLNGNFIASYPSINAAKRVVSGCAWGIASCCYGINDTAYGFIWKFKNEVDTKVCNMDCFHCVFPDCRNTSTKRTEWELYALKCAGL